MQEIFKTFYTITFSEMPEKYMFITIFYIPKLWLPSLPPISVNPSMTSWKQIPHSTKTYQSLSTVKYLNL